MGMHGADAPALRWFSGRARRSRNEIVTLRDRVTSVVDQLPWRGADRDRFVDDWRRIHAPAITHAAAELDGVAEQARRAAERQEAAAAHRP
jgi:uncharacterized protein YukE